MTDFELPPEDLAALAAAAPPRNLHAEMSVLGTMLGHKDGADDVAEILAVEDFYEPRNGQIFARVMSLSAAGKPHDAEIVAHALGADLGSVGGVPYLLECLQAPGSMASGTHYAEIVAELSQRRRILEAAAALQAIARRPGPLPEVVESAQQTIHEATTKRRDRTIVTSVGDLVDPVIEHMEAIKRGEIEPGAPTGLSDLDRLTGGMKPGQLWIPAGRTSMGKSVATQNWVINAAQHTQRPWILFSVEMSTEDMMNRLISQMARIPLYLITEGRHSDQDKRRIDRARDEIIYGMPLYLVDNVRTTPAIRAYCRRFQQKHGDLGGIGVDYLQLLQPVDSGRRNIQRHNEVGDQAHDLKFLGQDMHMPVLAPCQLNRGPESRPGKDANKPKLSDMRESGDLEQTADVAVLIFRPGYYDKNSTRNGEADFIVAKNRNGPTDTVTVAEQLHIQRFVDMAGPAGAEPRSWE